APLRMENKRLVHVGSAPTEEEIAAAQAAYDEWHAGIARDKQAFEEAAMRHQDVIARLTRARQAAAKLEELRSQEAPAVSDEDVEAARERLAEAERALRNHETYERATAIHQQIVRNTKLVDILAPEGLRRRKLAAGLERFNEKVAELCEVARW